MSQIHMQVSKMFGKGQQQTVMILLIQSLKSHFPTAGIVMLLAWWQSLPVPRGLTLRRKEIKS